MQTGSIWKNPKLWAAIVGGVVTFATVAVNLYVKDPDFLKLSIAAITLVDGLAGAFILAYLETEKQAAQSYRAELEADTTRAMFTDAE